MRGGWLTWLAATALAMGCGDGITVVVERPADPDGHGGSTAESSDAQLELDGYCERACERVDGCLASDTCAASCSASELACTTARSVLVYCLQGQTDPDSCSMPPDCQVPLFEWLECRDVMFQGICEGGGLSCACDVTDSKGIAYQTECDEGDCVCRVDGEAMGVCHQNVQTGTCAPLEDCCAGLFFVGGHPGDAS
jgi:hypothetical protein